MGADLLAAVRELIAADDAARDATDDDCAAADERYERAWDALREALRAHDAANGSTEER